MGVHPTKGEHQMSLDHSPARGRIPHQAYTISEFCEAHRISRGLFYILKGQGLAPRITLLAGKQIITDEDAATWRRERSEASASPEPAEQPQRADAPAVTTAPSI
jgi:hypothetical protein